MSKRKLPVKSPPAASAEAPARNAYREGTKSLSLYVEPMVHRQLTMLRLRREADFGGRVTFTDLLREALDNLFELHASARACETKRTPNFEELMAALLERGGGNP